MRRYSLHIDWNVSTMLYDLHLDLYRSVAAVRRRNEPVDVFECSLNKGDSLAHPSGIFLRSRHSAKPLKSETVTQHR